MTFAIGCIMAAFVFCVGRVLGYLICIYLLELHKPIQVKDLR